MSCSSSIGSGKTSSMSTPTGWCRARDAAPLRRTHAQQRAGAQVAADLNDGQRSRARPGARHSPLADRTYRAESLTTQIRTHGTPLSRAAKVFARTSRSVTLAPARSGRSRLSTDRQICTWRTRYVKSTLDAGGVGSVEPTPFSRSWSRIALPAGKPHGVEVDSHDTVRVEREMLHFVSGDRRAV